MNSKLFWLLTAFMGIFNFSGISGQQQSDKKPDLYAVSTFECSGIYWKTSESGPGKIRYKEASGNSWKNGLDLVYDSRTGEYRGSIIDLSPASSYQVELSSNSSKATLKVTTKDDRFPIGKTTVLPQGESDKTIVITESGTADAYHLVTVPEGSKSVLNIKNVSASGIEIDANYVIVRGVEIRNAQIHGILIRRDRHDIVVEQCHITYWGRMGGPITYGNEGGSDSGVYAENGTANLTIQRNLIEDPRGASNDWETGHPSGPQGITIVQSKGGNVIRFNDIVSSEDHGFNDAIGGGSNYSFVGNMNRDSDIYGNIIRNAWDDAIESEGGNMNVRIWGNYIHFFFNGVATASTTWGPIYVFRNVSGESRTGHWNPRGGAFLKTGERNEFGGGRRFLFHNTLLQPNGVSDVFSGHPNPNCVTRNNIFDVPGRLATDRVTEIASDYDYDYFSGNTRGTAKESNGIRFGTTPSGTKLYVSSYSLEFYPRSTINSIKWGAFPYEFGDRKRTITDPVVWIRNPLLDSGTILPGFNDNFSGNAPDLGAFEVGAAPLQFGRRAYLTHNQIRAPWEIY